MVTTSIEKIRGMNDVLPGDYFARKHIEAKLTHCFESFGFRPIELPIIEQPDLYFRKSGEDIVSWLYDFYHQNRHMCLRPEMTASVIRAYIDNFQGHSLPIRFYHSGPVFRHERPQKGRYRQFTQTGVELIGAGGPTADSEVIGMACKGLDALELNQYQVSIGHLGILMEFLTSLQLENRVNNFLLANIKTINDKGEDYILSLLAEKYPAYSFNTSQQVHASIEFDKDDHLLHNEPENLANNLANLDENTARSIIVDILQNMNIEKDASRSSDEIINRMLGKVRRRKYEPLQIRAAIQFLRELSNLKGNGFVVLKEAEKLLLDYHIDLDPLKQLKSVIQLLSSYDIDPSKITLDLGLNRGLRYYTGTIFEIHHRYNGDEFQLCGGGRYDDLVITLGGKKSVPASGFAFGLERLQLALQNEELLEIHPKLTHTLVVSVGVEDYPYAIQVAEMFRKEGLRTEVDVRNRSVTSNFQYANHQHIPFVVVLGSLERSLNIIRLKKLDSGEEFSVEIDVAIKIIKEYIINVA